MMTTTAERGIVRGAPGFLPAGEFGPPAARRGLPRRLFHVDLDAFFVSVERVLDPSLEGKPVIVGGNPEGRGVVAAASYEVRKYGVHSAMPLSRAKRLCPHALFIRGKREYYVRASRAVRGILRNYTPFIEWTSIDEGYLDMTGFERLYGHPLSTAERIKKEIAGKLRLDISIGISGNKLVSKVASGLAKPSGILEVLPGYERDFLAPLPVEKLPGVGEKVRIHLEELGIKRVEDLTKIEGALLKTVFGVTGEILRRKAMGGSWSPLREPGTPKSVGHETTFEEDTNDTRYLFEVLYLLTEKVGKRLRGKNLRGSTVTLKLRYSDFLTVTRARTLPSPTDLDSELFNVAAFLLKDLYSRRTRVRLLGLTVSKLRSGPFQKGIFEDPETEKRRGLYRQMDRVRDRYGFDAVRVARSMMARKKREGETLNLFN